MWYLDLFEYAQFNDAVHFMFYTFLQVLFKKSLDILMLPD